MRILVVEDDRALRAELASFLEAQGHDCPVAGNLAEARASLRGPEAPDLVLADLYLGGELGTELLAEAGSPPVVMVSGAGTIRDSVAALKAGAWDFLEKPVDPDRLLGLVRNLDRSLEAERGAAALRDAWLREHAVFAPGSPFGAALEAAARVAPSPLSVLVAGPTGSGKEVVARWIHYSSRRSGGPFVAVNCAAVPPDLAEASFFGVRRGAYTGAAEDRPGWFQAADRGTLFLDEIGDIPKPIQAKLLRAAEEGEVQRLGSSSTERVSVRLVSATGRDLEADMAAGSFRRDLYWRLAQATIPVPSLAERRADLGPLARFFLARAGDSFGEPAEPAGQRGPALDASALAWLEARPWPGNVRELKSFVERARWLLQAPVLDAAALASLDPGRGPGPSPLAPAASPIRPLAEAKADFERAYVERALAEAGGSVAKAAALLDLLPNNLSRKLRELGIERE